MADKPRRHKLPTHHIGFCRSCYRILWVPIHIKEDFNYCEEHREYNQ